MTAKKQLGSAMTLYAIGTFLQRFGAFILVPLYTSVLLIPEYGALETITVTFQVFMIIVNFGLSNAVIRFYHECQDKKEIFLMMRTSWISVIGISILFFFAAYPFFHSISQFLLRDNQSEYLLALTFFWAVGGALNQQYFAYYRARQDARTYILISFLYFIISTTLNIWFVRFLNLKVAGVLYGNLAVVWVINLIAFKKIFDQRPLISFKWMKKLFGFGLPLLVGILSWLILNSADRFFLAYYRDLSEVAIYGLGYKVGLIAQIAVVTPFQLAWAPYMFSKSVSSPENVRDDFSRFFTYLLTGFSLVGLGIYLFSSEIVHIFGSGKYPQATEVIPYILVAYLFSGVFYWAGSFLNLTKKNIIYSLILMLMALLNLFLDWLWIPLYGWKGAAWATVITIGGAGLFTLIAGEWVYPIRLEKVRILKLIIVVGIIILAHNFVNNCVFLSSLVLSIILLLSIPLLLFFVEFFTAQEKVYILKILDLIKAVPKSVILSHATSYPINPNLQWSFLWNNLFQKLVKRHKSFISSAKYWIDRYDSGGNSGSGSYDELALFKAEELNKLVQNEKITKIIEFGCGDGNQLSLSQYPAYIGFDISPKALDLCKS